MAGGTGNAYGMPGPSTKTYAQYSPDVNLMYYDPRERYLPRVNYAGNPLPVNAPATSWKVYFRISSGPYTVGSSAAPATTTTRTSRPTVVVGSTASYPTNVTAAMVSAGTLFPKFINRTDCVTNATSCTALEEGQNYANWTQWYTTASK